MGKNETGTLERLKATLNNIVRPSIDRHDGRIFKTMGDGVLAEFPSVIDAVNCAAAIQTEMSANHSEDPLDEQIRFRMGINLGDVIVDENDIFGDGVNVAARLESLAKPGGICISRQVRDQIRDKLAFALEDLGDIEVKNVSRPVRVFRVHLDQESGPSSLAASAAVVTRKKPGRRAVVTAATLLVALVGLGGFALWQFQDAGPDRSTSQVSPSPIPSKPSVAVLPFNNVNGVKEQEYFVNGLTDDLITDLSKVSGLFVIARNSVFSFKDSTVSLKEISDQLGVRFVVEGSVRRSGDRIRVNARLVEGNNGQQVWAERYDRTIDDIFAVQDDLVSRIVSALAVELTGPEKSKLSPRSPPKFRAYDLYLQGRDGYFSRDQARMRRSLDFFAKAWTMDPTFARPYAGYAQVAADIWRLSSLREAMTGATARKSAEVAARKALAIDPTSADAYSVLSIMKMVEMDYAEALKLASRAVDLEPNSAEAHTALAIVQCYAGQAKAALESMRTSMRLNPKPAPYHLIYYGLALFLNHRYEDAVGVLEPIAETPDRGIGDSPREILAMAYALTNRLGKARAQVDAMLKTEPYLNLSYYRVRYSHHEAARDLQHRLDALQKAGVPEWPFGAGKAAGQRITGQALKSLVASKTWVGNDRARARFIQEFGATESSVYAGPNTMLNGAAFIRGDELCERFEGFILGRDLCGPVFLNPGGTMDKQYEYTYVNPATVKYFSLKN